MYRRELNKQEFVVLGPISLIILVLLFACPISVITLVVCKASSGPTEARPLLTQTDDSSAPKN